MRNSFYPNPQIPLANVEETEMPFCPKCGAEVSDEAQFCPKCGSSLREMRVIRPREEKEEKAEKAEKEEKGEKHEKGGGRTGPIIGGLVLILLGTTFYLATIGIIRWMDWWAYFLLGLGGILLLQAVIVSASTGRIGPAFGSLIGGGVLLVIGVTWVLGIRNWWPLLLIALGLAIIISALRERTRSPRP
jgi:ribosomal protein L40E